jgi:hypothetical protein
MIQHVGGAQGQGAGLMQVNMQRGLVSLDYDA